MGICECVDVWIKFENGINGFMATWLNGCDVADTLKKSPLGLSGFDGGFRG
jgi:hypothetical protein